MLVQLVQRYSLKLVFALVLLLGLQLPSFLQQYEHRLDAHYLEVEQQLLQYQVLADRYFSGDLSALVEKHKRSADKVFREEALIIEGLVNRFNMLTDKKQRLEGPIVGRLYFLVGEFNSPLIRETRDNYTAQVVLNRDSITVGLVLALLTTLLLECLFIFITFKGKHISRYFFLKRKKPASK